MTCLATGEPGLQGFRGEAGAPGPKGRLYTDIVFFLNTVKCESNVTRGFSFHPAGDRGLAGFQGIKGLLVLHWTFPAIDSCPFLFHAIV